MAAIHKRIADPDNCSTILLRPIALPGVSTRQMGSLEMYVSRFITQAAQVPNLDDEHYLGQFLIGLRLICEDIITNIYVAVKWAR